MSITHVGRHARSKCRCEWQDQVVPDHAMSIEFMRTYVRRGNHCKAKQQSSFSDARDDSK
jgi:hypothetical protein